MNKIRETVKYPNFPVIEQTDSAPYLPLDPQPEQAVEANAGEIISKATKIILQVKDIIINSLESMSEYTKKFQITFDDCLELIKKRTEKGKRKLYINPKEIKSKTLKELYNMGYKIDKKKNFIKKPKIRIKW